MKTITIKRTDGILKGEIHLPFSKSITNRLLIIRALSGNDFKIDNPSDAEDTKTLIRLIDQISSVKDPSKLVEIDAGDAGTVMRFLAAYLAQVPGRWVLTGTHRMKQRPIGILIDGLKFLGADIEFLAKLGYPPILIKGKKLSGKEIVIDPEISSQFVSALIMIGPSLPGGLRMHMAGHPVSQPYIDMTLRLLEYFGVKTTRERSFLIIPESPYIPAPYTVEADWSSAAFWYEAVALSGDADLFLHGLRKNSLQGDAVVAQIFENLGVQTDYLENGIRLTKKTGITPSLTFNFNDHPDIAPAVIMTCAALGVYGIFDGLGSLKIKESDRFTEIRHELIRLGAEVEEQDESLNEIRFKGNLTAKKDLRFSSYGDHRMAMTFAPLALVADQVTIEEPDVVAKSYPGFWKDCISTGFLVD